ncbi:MAG: hypothetical protein KUG75_06170 [Pseudomonadales bacterium]|nr:hypothetical protein [Pseudomonadales bacterium]
MIFDDIASKIIFPIVWGADSSGKALNVKVGRANIHGFFADVGPDPFLN